jgi:hypothetical protein
MKKLINLFFLTVFYSLLISNYSFSQWMQKSNGMGTNRTVWSLAVSGNNIFAGTDAGVYLSTNNGEFWSLTSFNQSGNVLLINGNNIYAGSQGVFLSTNNGQNWTQIGLNNENVWALAGNGSSIFAGSANGHGVYRSTDNGINWTQTSLNNNIISSLVISGNIIIAGDWTTCSVFRSLDNGNNWTQIFLGGSGGDVVLCLAVNGNNFFAGTDNGGIFRSTNNGLNWALTSLDNVSVLSLTINNNNIFAGVAIWSWSHGGVFLSSDNGDSWILKKQGMSNCSVWSLATTSQYIFAGTDSSVWQRSISEITQTFSISGTVRYTDNNQPVTSGVVKAIKLNQNDASIIVYDTAIIQSNGTYILPNVPQDSVYIGLYPNSGTTQDYLISYYPSATDWHQAAGLYPTSNLTNIDLGAIRIQSTIANNFVNGKVMRLTNSMIGNLKDAVLCAKNGNTFVRCSMSDVNGVYHLPSLPTGNLKIIVNRLGFSNDSTTVNVTSSSNIDSINFNLFNNYTGIKQITGVVPADFKLYQNYPNPFNPVTKIKFDVAQHTPNPLSRGEMVTLKIFDILGREIITLVNEKLNPGTYEVTFDGSKYASGVYFYQLRTGDFVNVKRMVMIK